MTAWPWKDFIPFIKPSEGTFQALRRNEPNSVYVYTFAHSHVFNAFCHAQCLGAIQCALFTQHRAPVAVHKEIQCVLHTSGSMLHTMFANRSLSIHIPGSNSVIYIVVCISAQDLNICSMNILMTTPWRSQVSFSNTIMRSPLFYPRSTYNEQACLLNYSN